MGLFTTPLWPKAVLGGNHIKINYLDFGVRPIAG
jgi:hypothetical protein